MFDVVLCLQAPEPVASAEFSEGLTRLQAQAGASALWLHAPAVAPMAFDGATLDTLLPGWLPRLGHLSDAARVLLLAHTRLQLPDVSLQWLAEALCGADLSLSWSPAHPPAGFPPDYCTVRGLERYAHAMRQVVAPQSAAFAAGSSMLQTSLVGTSTLGALRAVAGGRPQQAVWVPGCFVHDFSAYHQGHDARREMLRWVPAPAQRVLDVGGGEGQFLALLQQARGCETHLSEFSEAACRRAAARVHHVWCGDFAQLSVTTLPDGGVGAFDCITFLDSLEHAANPGAWLDKAHRLLADDGCIVASVPNVGHWSVVADLLEGRWDYCPVGIHCVTHLRFFTRRTLADLLQRHGFVIEALEPTRVPAPADWRSAWLATPRLQTGGAELDTYAFVLRARKADAAVAAGSAG